MAPAWSSLEWQGGEQFYAFREQVEGTEPVYDFWHVGNQEHTFHFLPAWDREEQGDIQFYAYNQDPSSKAALQNMKASLKPVHAFWHRSQGQHQFHFLPAWGGEKQGTIQFYAY